DRLANSLELERSKVPGQLLLVQFPDRLDGIPDMPDLIRDPAMLDVIGFGPFVERQEQFVIRDVGPLTRPRPGEGPAVGQPLRDDPVILGPALPGPVFSQIEIPIAEGNDRSARRRMEAVSWRTRGLDRHGKTPEIR